MINASARRVELETEHVDQFPLIQRLPPYLFASIETQKHGLATDPASPATRRVVDFGLGRPDLPADSAVAQELVAGLRREGADSYAPSNGIPELRVAIAEWYLARYGVELDPDSETIVTIGSKEGISHLALAISKPGDVVFVPDPAYPIHESAFVIAGATVQRVPLTPIENYEEALERAIKRHAGKGRAIVLNFPSNPTGICVKPEFFERIVHAARKNGLWIIHDLAYADIVFDQDKAPSILSVKGAKEVAVEFFTMSKSYNMAGWRVGFMCGNPKLVNALKHAKSYFDYGTFKPIQQAAVVALRQGDDTVKAMRATYASRRNVMVTNLNRIGWDVRGPDGGMFIWARIPPAYNETKSRDFAKLLMASAGVVVSPGVGFGPAGDDHVRFSLVQNEATIQQAVEAIASALQ